MSLEKLQARVSGALVDRATRRVPGVVSVHAQEIEHAVKPSQLRAALAGTRVEAIAIAAALGARRNPEVAKRARVSSCTRVMGHLTERE